MPTCPTCGLFNPPDALRCDCGYRFIDDVITQEPLTGAGFPGENAKFCTLGHSERDR
jgi:hypothetical protein